MKQNETWRPISESPSMYEVSDLGRIRSFAQMGLLSSRGRSSQPRILKQSTLNNGYKKVSIHVGATGKQFLVHRLVAAAFLGDPTGLVVRHIDGSRDNNRVSNLLIGTASENMWDAVAHGTHFHAYVTHCPQGHEYTPANTYKRPATGYRVCRECSRASARRSHHRKLETESLRRTREWSAVL